jgi:tetratricopeptide (TPR) repeat protein
MEAIKHFDQAAHVIYSKGDKDPTRLGYYAICKSNIAQCCMNFGNVKGAIKYNTDALSMDPKNKKALYRRGMSHLWLDQLEEALRDLKCSLELNRSGDVEKDFRKSIGSVNFKNTECFSPLYSASKKGHLGIAAFLLSLGAKIHD